MSLDEKIAQLAEKYLPLAEEILREAIRIPADYVDSSTYSSHPLLHCSSADPRCGTSNHEEPRVKYLRQAIIDNKAVENEEDVWFDAYGSLVWKVEDK
jgi:hypothetical protein